MSIVGCIKRLKIWLDIETRVWNEVIKMLTQVEGSKKEFWVFVSIR